MEDRKDTVKVNRDPEEVNGSVRSEEYGGQPEEAKRSEELPRLDNGLIDVELVSGGRKDDKGRFILPRDVIEKHYKSLPSGCVSDDRQVWTCDHGLLRMPNEEVRRKGAESLNARNAQRRTFREAIDVMLRDKANKQNIEELHLTEDATNLDVIIAAALKQSAHGNVKAMDFLRDTVGEKPAEQLSAEITGLSAEDKQMLENIKNRLQED